ncbi:MAG: FhaA domain-containing protein [Solirubrobacteraceae bacterium]
MSFLRNLESKIANFVEGTFSRAFSSEVRPIEIARKLAREMEEHKSFSVSRTYVPNEYLVYLSPRDRERLSEYEDALVAELAGYLLEHARRERLAMLSRPVIEFRTDDRLRLGEFGIQTRVTHPEGDQEGPPAEPEPALEPRSSEPVPEPRFPEPVPEPRFPEPAPEPRSPGPLPASAPSARPPEGGRTMVYSSAERVAEPLQESARVRAQSVILVVDGKRMVVGDRGATVGRSRQCEIVLDDPNVSRRHGELRPRGGSWVFTDLGSTNGSRVNGRPVEGPTVVKHGDEIELGTAVTRFELQ